MKTILFPLFVPHGAFLLLGEHFFFWEEKYNTQLSTAKTRGCPMRLDMSVDDSNLPHDAV